jgi:hypothetical protein
LPLFSAKLSVAWVRSQISATSRNELTNRTAGLPAHLYHLFVVRDCVPPVASMVRCVIGTRIALGELFA